MQFFTDFNHEYEVMLPAELPGYPAQKRIFYYPGARESGGKDGILVHVMPRVGMAWFGIFAFGDMGVSSGPNGVYSCPDPNSVCVVSDGEGYLVKAQNPKDWLSIPCDPILDVKLLSNLGLLVFVNFTEIIAWGSTGVVWRTDRLALDGITITKIDNAYIYGTATCLCHDGAPKHDFTVDIKSGKHTGGWPF